MKKRIVLFLLTLVLLSINLSYADSTPSAWAMDGVKQIEGLGLFEHNLDYQKHITREEFVDMLIPFLDHYIADKEYKIYRNFNDVKPYILEDNNMMIAGGWEILTGTGDRMANPKGLITREQVSVMLQKSMSYIEKHTPISLLSNNIKYTNFKDSAKMSSWALDSINYALKNKLMSGVSKTEFNPAGNLTVEQALLILNNMFNLINDQYVKEIDFNWFDDVYPSDLYIPDYFVNRNTFQIRNSLFFTFEYDMYNLKLILERIDDPTQLYGYIYEPNSLLKIKHDDITNFTNLSEVKASNAFESANESITEIRINGQQTEVRSYQVVKKGTEMNDYLPMINFYCDKNSGEILQILVLYREF